MKVGNELKFTAAHFINKKGVFPMKIKQLELQDSDLPMKLGAPARRALV